jgi:redox-sensitive bicupin YhaK (pirin superfamily)
MSHPNLLHNVDQGSAAVKPPHPSRDIDFRSRGTRGGPITRLASPSDLGNLIKPFVFLDAVKLQPSAGANFGFHPHSGIATVTLIIDGSVWYEESNGKRGILAAGDVEWMRAGSGVWHASGVAGTTPMRGFQLWVALSPEFESAPAESHYLGVDQVSYEWPVRVILGRYGNAKSPIHSHAQLNYLDVQLKAGDRWLYPTPPGHKVGWVFVYEGSLRVPGQLETGEIAVFSDSDERIFFEAAEDTRFLLGSAERHPYPLFLGQYSVHTSQVALSAGEETIRRLGKALPGRSFF